MGMSQVGVLARSKPVEGKTSPTLEATSTLSPGMNITAEIKTGQRRIIEYLLSPVQRAAREALRER